MTAADGRVSAIRRTIGTAVTAGLLRGALRIQTTPVGVRPHRLPASVLRQAADPQLAMAQSQPSGVRISVDTAATSIELVALATGYGYRGLPARPLGVFDLLVDGRLTAQASLDTAVTVVLDPATGAAETTRAQPGGVVFDPLPPGPKSIEIWLPHLESVELVELVELRSDEPVHPQTDGRPVWLHYGNSISHGSNATHPTGTWPRWRPCWRASTWSTSASAAARCWTRSPRARSATPRPT